MKSFLRLALVSALAGGGITACSSNPTSNTPSDGGTFSDGGTSTDDGKSQAGSGVATAGSTTTSMGGSGVVASGGSVTSLGGSAVSTGGSASSGGSAPTAMAGSPSAGTGNERGGSSAEGGGGAGGSGPLPPYLVTCAPQKYTPTAKPGAVCVTTMVPEEQVIASFEGKGVAPGWGVYPNVDGSIGFTPTTATPTPGGADGSDGALAFKVTSLPQGIKVQVGFGTQCQDVRNFTGLRFWAKGTIDGTTQPFIVTANTLVIQLGSEKSLLGGCQGASCSAAPPDKRVSISADWREYRIPFNCFGDGKIFDGYYRSILFNAFGPNSSFAIDDVGYY